MALSHETSQEGERGQSPPFLACMIIVMEEGAVGKKSAGGDTIGGSKAWASESGPAATSCPPVDTLLTGLAQEAGVLGGASGRQAVIKGKWKCL